MVFNYNRLMSRYILYEKRPQQNFVICARCVLGAKKVFRQDTRRSIGTKYLAKVAEAEKQWKNQATLIRDGKKKSMLSILEERELVHQIAGDRDKLNDLMINKRIGVYVGIDPTASSLHVGHMVPLMALFWMYVHGFHAVSLLGGATVKIGDPTGRLKSREREEAHIRTARIVKIHYQLKKIWMNVEAYGKKYGYNWEWSWHRELVNNNAWLNKLNILEFLQILGSGMRLGTMLAKDSVKNKMTNGDGMSFSEFSYPLLQAWDWWHMYNTKGLQMQIGGADQYGNIVTGINAINYIVNNHPNPDILDREDGESTARSGFTVPLLTAASGEKFGKSAGNAIWLDPELTSSFELYGFFMRQSDADVGRYLRLFTFLPLERIDTIVREHMNNPKIRKAQHLLAREFVEIVHGVEAAKKAETQHRLLFSGPRSSAASVSILEDGGALQNREQVDFINLNNAPDQNVTLPMSLIQNASIARVLYAANLAVSISHGHRLVTQGSIYVGGLPGEEFSRLASELSYTRVGPWGVGELAKYVMNEKLLILRRGKHHIKTIHTISDEEWIASGKKYAGEVEAERVKRQRQLTLASKRDENFSTESDMKHAVRAH